MNVVLEPRYQPVMNSLERYCGNRTVVLWGESGELEPLLLSKYDVISATYDIKKIENKSCTLHMDELNGKRDEYYIVIPWLERNDRRINILNQYGYHE